RSWSEGWADSEKCSASERGKAPCEGTNRAAKSMRRVAMCYPKLPGSGIVLVALLVCLLLGTADAGQMSVPADEPTIQQAIDVAVNGEGIVVSPGEAFDTIAYRAHAIHCQS